MRSWLLLAVALATGACTKTPAYLYGRDLTRLQFQLYSPDMGIHPDQSILSDPNNPFADDPPTESGKWVLQADAGPVAAFYAWATLDAETPGGEAQFYTAKDLEQIFRTGQAADGDLPAVAALAIRGYQAVLDAFPDSVTYDATGKIAYDLATPSYQGIVGLGGTVQGGWVLLQASDGSPHAVRP